MTTPAIEPSADEIERVTRAVKGAWRKRARWDDVACAAILATDRRASPPAPAVEVPELLGKALAALDNYADPTGYTDCDGEQLDANEKVHEGLLAKSVAAEIRAAIAAAPTPPAAEAPGQEPDAWRELMQQAADALSTFTGHDIQPNLKHRYGEHWWEPVNALRDKLIAARAAPPTYADAEAKGIVPTDDELRREVAKAISIAAWGSDRFWNTLLAEAEAAILAIRSLAPPAAEAPGQETVASEAWIENLSRDLVVESERAIRQRDEFMRIGKSTASHGGSHDTCFAAIIRQHVVSAPPTYADAEAMGFARGFVAGKEASAVLVESLPPSAFYPGAASSHATAIRSLASPAPKEQGQ